LVLAFDAGWISVLLTRSREAGVLAGLLVLGTMGAHFQNYVAMNDPQLFGQALQYTALGWFLSQGSRRRVLLAVAALMLLGGLVKPNLLALPLGITVWLAWRHPRRLRVWLAAAAAGTVLILLILAAAFGSAVFSGILGHARTYHLHLLLAALTRWFVPVAPVLAGALGMLVVSRQDPRESLLLICSGWALVFGLSMSLGAGVNYNAIFDLTFLSCILSSIFVHRLVQIGPGATARPLAMVAVASSILFAAPLRAYSALEDFQARGERRTAAAQDVAFVASLPGDAMCEDPAVCYWAGKSFEVDFFNLGQKLALGRLRGRPLVDRLRRQDFAVVQTHRERRTGHFDEAVDEALRQSYELARVSAVNGYFYVPRR
jgi:hypothetical protein